MDVDEYDCICKGIFYKISLATFMVLWGRYTKSTTTEGYVDTEQIWSLLQMLED